MTYKYFISYTYYYGSDGKRYFGNLIGKFPGVLDNTKAIREAENYIETQNGLFNVIISNFVLLKKF